MDMELQRSRLEGYHLFLDTVLTQEETLDSIIPDALPDVSRVICAVGNGFLTMKQPVEGTVKAVGTTTVNVLYIPEGDTSIRSVQVNIPFQCSTDCNQLNDKSLIHADVLSICAEARLINPRKLFIRAEMRIELKAYNCIVRDIVCDLAAQADPSIQKLQTDHTEHTIFAVLEKCFTFSDVLRQSGAKPAMDELLFWTLDSGCLESKYIGKKLICKGELLLNALYRSGTEAVHAKFEIPFSQIVDMESTFEESIPDVTISLKSAQCALLDGEVQISIDAVIQAAMWSQRKVTLLTDVYSTAAPLDTERTMCSLCAMSEQISRRESCRKFCESATSAKQVLYCSANLSPLTSQRTDNGIQYEGAVEISILYLSEENMLCSAAYTVPTSCTVDIPADCLCFCSGKPIGEPAAVPVTGGFEVRAELEFCWRHVGYKSVPNVSSIRKNTAVVTNEKRPSVILRVVGKEDALWEIAKSCSSTIDDICSANHLTTEFAEPGTVLLIPVHR